MTILEKAITTVAGPQTPEGGESEAVSTITWPATVGMLLRRHVFAVVAYVLATWFTAAQFMADSGDYAAAITAFEHGRIYEFWDFGHLVWRPCTWALYHFVYAPAMAVASQSRPEPLHLLQLLNWWAGLACVILLSSLLWRYCRNALVTNFVVLGFIASNGFLNFAQTGSSYIPGLAMFLLALYALSADEHGEQWRTAILAGVATAWMVCFWFLYVWAIPAIAAFPLCMHGFDRKRWTLAIRTMVVAAGLGLTCYAVVIFHLGIHTISGLKAWIASSGHGLVNVSGAPRMVFGFARTWLDMGTDGTLFKRYLLHDPYNPVSFAELFRASLWKFLLVYLFFAACTYVCVTRVSYRRTLLFWCINAIPVLTFALFWFGGDVERYLALYPATMLLLGMLLSRRETPKLAQLAACLFIGAMLMVNPAALANTKITARRDQVYAMLRSINPAPTPQSKLVVSAHHPVPEFKRDNPTDPVTLPVRSYVLVDPSLKDLPRWRGKFASMAMSTWDQGGDLWFAQCLLGPRPGPDCRWVEGEDPRVSWHDVATFLGQLDWERSQATGAFVKLPRSPHNQEMLTQYAAGRNSEAIH